MPKYEQESGIDYNDRSLCLKELVELFGSDILLVDAHSILYGSKHFVLHSAVGDVVAVFRLLKQLMSILVDDIVGEVAHAILSKLLCGIEACKAQLVFVLHLHIIVVSHFLLDELPLKLLLGGGPLFFDLLLVGVLVLRKQEAFQESLGQLKLAHFLAQHALGIESEAIVAVVFQLIGKHLFHLLGIRLFIFGYVLAQNVVEEFLIHLGKLIDENLGDRELEVALHLGVFGVEVERSGQLVHVTINGFVGIVDNLLAHFLAHKFLLFFLILNVARRFLLLSRCRRV